MIKSYNNYDKTQLSKYFNVQEFKCKCCENHDILISSDLVAKLEELRTALNCSKIIITSGYRCSNHDKNVGGSGTGQHVNGTAVDCICYDKNNEPISSKIVSCVAQDLGFGGIANITSSYTVTHLDVRESNIWKGDETKGTSTITSDFYSYYGLSKADIYKSNSKDVTLTIDGVTYSGTLTSK